MAEKLIPIWVPESEYEAALLKLYPPAPVPPDDEVARLVSERSQYEPRTREYGRLTAAIGRARRRLSSAVALGGAA